MSSEIYSLCSLSSIIGQMSHGWVAYNKIDMPTMSHCCLTQLPKVQDPVKMVLLYSIRKTFILKIDQWLVKRVK